MLRDFSKVIAEHLANYSVLSVMFITALASAVFSLVVIFPQISNKTNERVPLPTRARELKPDVHTFRY